MHYKRKLISFFIIVMVSKTFSQNNIRLFTGSDNLFIVNFFDKNYNAKAQTDVLIEAIADDTLNIKLLFEDSTWFKTTLFLFDQGKPTKNKEFNYIIQHQSNKNKVSFVGMYDVVALPTLIVPNAPIIDTSNKYTNTLLGHYCELKDDKPIYFNNIPKDLNCSLAMPTEYLNYLNILMAKTQVADDKYNVAESTIRNNCYTTSQLITILSNIDYEIEKLKLIKLGYNNLIDKENKKDLEKAFRFEPSVIELNSFFKTYADTKSQLSNTCKQASSNIEFQKLTSVLISLSNDSQRLDVFKKDYFNYCYSILQVQLVLDVFVHDREKLEAAKLIYYYCVEKSQFLSLSESFSYNETANELKNFVDKQNN